ncbi:MAG: hypothetical protein M1819_000470 [Sarea resinae]|nr:MAG: hypothetical protein M1819_000470 [Sarea resinae]
MPREAINGIQLIYSRFEPSPGLGVVEKTPILLLHALGTTDNSYQDLSRVFRNSNSSFVVIRNLGSWSSHRPKLPLSIPLLASLMLEFLDRLSIAKAVVVGHHLGALVAAYMASTWSERVETLVMIGPIHPEKRRSEYEALILRITKDGSMRDYANSIAGSHLGSKATVHHRACVYATLVACRVADFIAQCRIIAEAAEPFYPGIICPTLIIGGADEALDPSERYGDILVRLGKARIPSESAGMPRGQLAHIQLVPGVGDYQVIEAGEKVGKMIVGFLDTTARANTNDTTPRPDESASSVELGHGADGKPVAGFFAIRS